MLKNKPVLIIAAVVAGGIALSGILSALTSSDSKPTIIDEAALFEVKQGPLKISVVEPGAIKAREQVIIKNEVEGRRSIIYLIAEGTRVKKGDLLVELDSSDLVDAKIDQEIRVQNAEASFIRARENLAVVENQAKSDVDKAELTFEFSKQDLKKYLEGEYPNKLTEAESKITLAREELLRSQEKLTWSKRLFEENYLSQTELQQDELAVSRNTLDLQKAENDLDLLKNYTHKRQVDELQSDVTQAEMALERTTRKAKADVVQAQADLQAKEAEYKRQQDKLAKIEDLIGKTKIIAPSDGLVVYATSASFGPPMRRFGSNEPLAEGQDVRERQPLIHLPATSSVKAEISIHETNMEKVNVGMPVRVTVDALPGSVFNGYVAKIAPLPDPQSTFMNPDLKVYNADVFIESNGVELRTGMSCNVEIIIEQHNDAVYVPVQSVIRVKGEPTVYVVNGSSYHPRQVEIGLDNNRMIHVLSGLNPGEYVMLNPPLASGTVVDVVEDNPNPVAAVKMDEEKKDNSAPPIKTENTESTVPDGIPASSQDRRQQMMERFQNMSPEERQQIRQRMGGENRGGFQNLSPEQRQQIRERFQNMSPEQLEQMRQRYQNMSPEDRQAAGRQRGSGTQADEK